MSSFITAMDKLAAEIAKEATGDSGNGDEGGRVFADKIDAFKALMPYYALQMKNKVSDESAEDDAPNFDNFQNKIHAVR